VHKEWDVENSAGKHLPALLRGGKIHAYFDFCRGQLRDAPARSSSDHHLLFELRADVADVVMPR
jgi:hypothetical protein